MKHTEHEYHSAGYNYEKAQSLDAGRAAAQRIRVMLESESIDDRTYARELIEQGRKEARA